MQTTKHTLQHNLLQKMHTDILRRNISISTEANDDYVKAIYEHFPFIGSKIDWAKMPYHFHEKVNHSSYFASIHSFFDRIIEAAELVSEDKLVVIGDSIIDVTLIFSVEILRKYLEDIVALPQHTYITPLSLCWCACFTMEGDMDFGSN